MLQSLANSERSMRGMPLQYVAERQDRHDGARRGDTHELRSGAQIIDMPETPSRDPIRPDPPIVHSMQTSPKRRADKQVNFSMPPQIKSFDIQSESISELHDDMSLDPSRTDLRLSMPVHSKPPTTSDPHSSLQSASSHTEASESRMPMNRFTKSTSSLPTSNQHPRQEPVRLEDQKRRHEDGEQNATSHSRLLQENPRSKKRERELDLDYEPQVLLSKTLHDLQGEVFLHDPSAEPQEFTRSLEGHGSTLEEQLGSLNQLSEADRKILFMNQSDDDWEKTGQWFVDKLRANVQRVQQIRLERRQIALTFEDEIRRRHAAVKHAEKVVTKELKELHEGGGALLKGREPASRSGTPVRPARGL